jgi:hypothetical protein
MDRDDRRSFRPHIEAGLIKPDGKGRIVAETREIPAHLGVSLFKTADYQREAFRRKASTAKDLLI